MQMYVNINHLKHELSIFQIFLLQGVEPDYKFEIQIYESKIIIHLT